MSPSIRTITSSTSAITEIVITKDLKLDAVLFMINIIRYLNKNSLPAQGAYARLRQLGRQKPLPLKRDPCEHDFPFSLHPTATVRQ